MNGTELGKLLIMLGMGAILVGLVIIALSKFISLGHLPGDIVIKGDNHQAHQDGTQPKHNQQFA